MDTVSLTSSEATPSPLTTHHTTKRPLTRRLGPCALIVPYSTTTMSFLMALAQGNAAPGALQRVRDTRQAAVLSTKARFNWLRTNTGFENFIQHVYDNITLGFLMYTGNSAKNNLPLFHALMS